MANPQHLKILKKGITGWNRWREKHPRIKPNLSAAKLVRAKLKQADLSRTDLTKADLREADLTRANLRGAKLSGADLARAKIVFANLEGVTLSKTTNLFKTTFVMTDLSHADIRQANFSRALFGFNKLGDLDLSLVSGLEHLYHLAPSTLGIDTIYRSNGKIPEAFLHGCGVPPEMIDFIRSMSLNPIEFNSCFISYSTKDQEFATRLHADLQASGVRCWFAPHDVQGGKKLHEQIDWAIHFHDRTLLILSPDSINSAWVKTEIAKARKREVEENRQILFPIRLVEFDVLKKWQYFDADRGTDYAKEIREYFIPDFSNWKDHDSYQKAFKDLLRDLKNERTKVAPVR